MFKLFRSSEICGEEVWFQMIRVRYLRRWKNEGRVPTPVYHFYPNGKAEDKGYTLAEGLKRFPENKYEWVEIRE